MGSPSATEEELHFRARQQEVIADLGQRALETDDLDELMREACEAVAETFDAEFALVLELLPGGEQFRLRQGAGCREEAVGDATVPADRDSQAGYTLLSKEPVIVDDLAAEDQFEGDDLLVDHGVASGITVPVGSVEAPWGVLAAFATERSEFTERDANFVRSVANVLAAANENERTENELEEIYGRISDAFFALDEEWRFTHVNERAHELINPGGRELVGENVWEAFPEAIGKAFEPKYERAMYEQETVSFEEYYPEPLDAWFEVRAYPSETGLSVYFRDVTERKERERDLELFRNLVDHSTDSVFVIHPETGRFLDANETSCRRLGYDREELLDMTVPDVEANLPDLEAWREHAEEVRSAGDVTFDGRHQRADGSTFPVEVNVIHATLDREYLLAIARDVTDRKAAQRRLEESERRYRTLVEHFPNGAVTLVDSELRYQTVGGSPLDVADVTIAELEGRPVQEAVPSELADELVPRYEAALEGDASSFELELDSGFFQFRIVPITDEAGEVFAALGMSQEVTEQKETQRKLAESERRYRTLVEKFPNGAVGLFDEDLRYVAAGGSAFDDVEAAPVDVIGQTVRERYPPELADRMESAFEAALDGERSTFEIEFHGRHWLTHVVPIGDEEIGVSGGAVMVQDVTERVERERELEELVEKLGESNERLEQFAYAASHDLQEPLRMVSSYLQLIERRYADELDDDGEEFIEFAVDGAERMREMIEGLLQYSRVDTRGGPFEPIDLDAVLADVVEDLQVKIEERGAEVTTGDLPTVEGDGGQLRQVFQNLLDNAIEYSGEGRPRVHVSAERNGREWVIAVRDEGIGIDADDADRVFDVFQRLHSRNDYDGTGIGLALCERIVERHGGDIWVESEPGEGSTFFFTLPAISGDAE